jgi:hypothetical protein
MPLTTRAVITQSLQDLGILAANEALSASDADFALQKLARLIDNWNAEREAVYVDRFETFTLTPSLSPHTIGPTAATWTATQRPVSIEAANLILPGSPAVRTTINLRDVQWYEGQSVPDLETTIPTDLYYAPTWPNGSLYFWPIPTAAYDVELQTRIVLAELALDDTFTMPPGYRDAITLTLAEELAPSYGQQIPERLALSAQQARARIFANNDQPRRISTADAGMPSGGGKGSYFNYRSGSFT